MISDDLGSSCGLFSEDDQYRPSFGEILEELYSLNFMLFDDVDAQVAESYFDVLSQERDVNAAPHH